MGGVWGSGFKIFSGLRVQGRRFFAEGVVDHASFVASEHSEHCTADTSAAVP